MGPRRWWLPVPPSSSSGCGGVNVEIDFKIVASKQTRPRHTLLCSRCTLLRSSGLPLLWPYGKILSRCICRKLVAICIWEIGFKMNYIFNFLPLNTPILELLKYTWSRKHKTQQILSIIQSKFSKIEENKDKKEENIRWPRPKHVFTWASQCIFSE